MTPHNPRYNSGCHRLHRVLLFAMVLCLLGMANAAEQAASTATLPPDLARIQATGILRVALTHADYPPFYERQAGGLRGLDIDLAHDVARRLGVDVQFNREASSWDDIVAVIAARKADVAIAALSRSLPRAQRVAYTQPYLTLPQALLVNRLKLAGLAGEGEPVVRLNNPAVRIGTLRGSSYVNFAKAAFPAAQVEVYDQWSNAVNALVSGRIHAVMFDALLCKRTLLARPELALQLQMVVTQRPDPIAMAVNWRDREWVQWLNVYIDTIRGDGYLQALEAKYIGPGVRHAEH